MNRTAFQAAKRRKIIKKYGNRKLYDTEQSSYVVLKDIEKMIRNREEIQVIDNETDNDITVPTLTQIIFSSEKRTKVAPPLNVLKTIIRDGDGSFSSFLSKIGLFERTESARRGAVSSQGKNRRNLPSRQNLERKITGLMAGEGGIPQDDNSIPELPGSHLT